MPRRSRGSCPIPPPGRPRYGRHPDWWPRWGTADLGAAHPGLGTTHLELTAAVSDFRATNSGDAGLGAERDAASRVERDVEPEGVRVTGRQETLAYPLLR
jgi:hypothetical protein